MSSSCLRPLCTDARVKLPDSTVPSNTFDDVPPSTSTSPSTSPGTNQASTSSSSSSSSNAGAIVGGVIGGVAFIACVAFAVLLYIRRRRRKRIAPSSEFMNALNAGTAPVFRLEPSVPRDPEKSGLSHYLPASPSPPPPFPQATYYSSPAMSSMEFPDPMVIPSPKPLEPNRYSAQPTPGVIEIPLSHGSHSQDDNDPSSSQWDGDPIIDTPTVTPRVRGRRPESAPAPSNPPASASRHRSHHQPQNSYPGVSPLAVSQMSGLEADSQDVPVQRATSLRPLRRKDHHWGER